MLLRELHVVLGIWSSIAADSVTCKASVLPPMTFLTQRKIYFIINVSIILLFGFGATVSDIQSLLLILFSIITTLVSETIYRARNWIRVGCVSDKCQNPVPSLQSCFLIFSETFILFSIEVGPVWKPISIVWVLFWYRSLTWYHPHHTSL